MCFGTVTCLRACAKAAAEVSSARGERKGAVPPNVCPCPASERQYPILGLNLLRLLAQNRIAEFHTELELLPTAVRDASAYIKFPAQLEQHIMEGSYNRVLSAKQEGMYAQEGMYFMDMLVDTVILGLKRRSDSA